MKPVNLLLLPACLATAAAALFATGCGNAHSSEFTTDSITCVDSTSLGDSRAYCSITVAYPATGPQALVDTVSAWIGRQLSVSPYISPDTAKTTRYAAFTNGTQLLTTAASELMVQSLDDFREYARDSISINYEFSWLIRPVCDSTLFVTYASSTYSYVGGAHGSAGYTPATFDKATGHRYGWDMIQPDSISALRTLLKNQLLTDFFRAPSYADIRDGLFIDPDTMPLPATPPCFTSSGVDFTYMQYEIAPYATGMPSCVIPYSVISPMLTPGARALLQR